MTLYQSILRNNNSEDFNRKKDEEQDRQYYLFVKCGKKEGGYEVVK